MKKVVVFDDSGKKAEEITLNKDIFGVEPNLTVMALALKRQRANGRKNIAHAKLKSEVRGGGRKPFRQKGTGRARQGGSRSPINRGGGVVFGPRNNRNFSIQMPKKQRRLALFSALSQKLNDDKIFALSGYTKKEIKTKDFNALVAKLPVEKSLLVILDQPNEIIQKSAANLPQVKVILAQYLNMFDLLKYDSVCFLKDALPVVETTFLSKS